MHPAKARPHPVTHKLTTGEKLAFASGFVTAQTSHGAMLRLLTPIYQITLGVNPLLIGLALTIMRLWDAVTDPLMASISDNTRTRWGRRRPYIFFGGIICSLAFPLIWTPSAGWSEITIFIYLMVSCLIFATSSTVYSVPYESLGMELTTDYNEKTRLYAFRSYLPPFLGLAIEWIYPFVQSDFFSSPMAGMRAFAIGFGVLMLCTALLPAIFLRERNPQRVAAQKKVPLLRSMKETLQCRPFIRLLIILVFGGLAGSIFSQLGMYANIYLLYEGNTKSGAILGGFISIVFQVVYLASIPLGVRLSRMNGKAKVYMAAMALTYVGGLTKLWIYNPDMPYLVLLLPFFSAPGAAIHSYMFSSMMTDVCNYDEWKTGERREAMFAGVGGWFYKLSFSLSGVLSGALLVAIGFDEQLGGGQSTTTLFWLLYGMILGSCLPPVISILALLRWPLTPKVMEECAAELEQRNSGRLSGSTES